MRSLFAVATFMAFCATAAANPVRGVYTGGDPGEGLDFQGNFAYAIDFGGATTANPTIGDAKFTGWQAGATPGATIVANQEDSGFFQTGTTAADAALESLVDTGRWADGTNNITANLNVQPGRQYLLQLIFQEGWNASAPGIRQFNIDVEGTRLATNFDITEVTGAQTLNRSLTPPNETPNTRGAVLSYSFTAADSTANIVLSHGAIDNPRIEALTLEIIPEPGTLALVGLMLVSSGCALVMRRRRS
jgi:hypothetical protein